MTQYQVHAKWDAEAGVWSVYSDDIPGLVTEAPDWDALRAKLGPMAAELIAMNHVHMDRDGGEIQIVVENERVLVAA